MNHALPLNPSRPARGLTVLLALGLALPLACASEDAPLDQMSRQREDQADTPEAGPSVADTNSDTDGTPSVVEPSPDAGASSEPASSDPAPPSDAAERVREWFGDGTTATVKLAEVYKAPEDVFCTLAGCRPWFAADLDWNPFRPGELWVVFRHAYAGEPCERSGDTSGCALLDSMVAVISEADGDAPSAVTKQDGNAWHFMRAVTAIAFGDDDTFATVGEARTGNYTDEALDYMGPTWWSADPAIFAQDFMLNGSHLDMLHATPYGMGIAHDPTLRQDASGALTTEPVYWAFNGQSGAIDRYDFNLPHEPGGEDHSDGELARYVDGELKMVPQVPSHLAFADRSLVGLPRAEGAAQTPEWWLYIADTGNQRVLRLDPNSGQIAADPLINDDGQIKDPKLVQGATLAEVVAPGVLSLPSGIAVLDDLLFVSDAATSSLVAFDLDGNLLGQLDTGLPEGSLAGLAVGPDRRLYFVDWNEARVFRLEPR